MQDEIFRENNNKLSNIINLLPKYFLIIYTKYFKQYSLPTYNKVFLFTIRNAISPHSRAPCISNNENSIQFPGSAGISESHWHKWTFSISMYYFSWK